MMVSKWIISTAVLFFSLVTAAPTTNVTPTVAAERYIVLLKPSLSSTAVSAHLDSVRVAHTKSRQDPSAVGILKQWSLLDQSAYVGKFDQTTVAGIKANSEVK
jgi:hypothetical protein